MRHLFVWITFAALIASSGAWADEPTAEQRATQSELDAACEVARQKNIAVEQAREIERCLKDNEAPDRASCEELYKYYGEATGNRPALFYDLPECKAAHKFRNSY